MHTSRDDYLINTLRFVSAKETTQIYGAILPESLTSLEMKETKAYKTYLGFATGATPPKKARKFKKPTSPQLSTVLVSPKEPTGKETLEMPLSKKKEKVDVARGKEIDLISKVELTEEAQYEEIRKKSLRDFHKTHPSGSGIVTKTAPSATKIKPSVTNEGTGVKPGVPDVTEEESSESEAESWGNDEDDSNNDHNSESDGSDQENDNDDDKTHSDNENESDSEHETDENESAKITDKADGDEDEEMDYTTKEGTDAEITIVQQGNENPEISQVIEDAHVTLSTIPQKTEVPVTSSSHSSDLASKFLNFSDIPHTNAAMLTISPNVEVSFFTLLRTTDDVEDVTFDVYALPCFGLVLFIQRISLTGFPAQSVGSSNTDVLDSPCLLVLITGTSQSRQHVITSLIHIESCKSPTKSLLMLAQAGFPSSL
ncbi:hypothetical protein Tco_1154830 [Tanacetum coccineum]